MELIAKMKALSNRRLHTKTPPSLFIWLLSCFLAIVLLLTSFILYSLFFFRGHIKDEIIQYNNVNLKNTTDSYEHQFQLIENAVLSFSLSDKLTKLNHQEFDYVEGHQLMDNIQNFLSNPSLYLDNLIIYFKTNGMALEKSRGTGIENMFTRFFNSSSYPYNFWKAKLDGSDTSRILPYSDFAEIEYSHKRTNSRLLIPMIIKNQNYPSISFIAMADTQKMFDDFHRSINENFYILDDAQHPFYYKHTNDFFTFPPFPDTQGYVKQGKIYFFYKKGASSGFTYVNIIQDDTISSQMKWNLTFVLLLVFSVLIGVAASFVFSMKLNKPVKRIVDSILQQQFSYPSQSSIKEFKFIHERVKHIVQTNRDISQNLQMNHSLLRHYAYITKLKKIRDNVDYLKDLIDVNKPYRFVLFKLTFKPGLLDEIEVDAERAASFIREYINQVLADRCLGSLTFQMENDQILSIVYDERDEKILLESLKEIKQVLELDDAYCYLTIAVSSRRERQEEFNTSYNQVKDLIRYRKYNGEIQILYETVSKSADVHYLMPFQEEEIDMGFHNGNEALLIQIVKRELMQLKKREATESQVHSFTENLILKAQKALLIHHLDGESLEKLQDRMKHQYSFGELDSAIEEWIPKVTALIQSKKEKRNHITGFVLTYLDEHYDKDVSLDTLADKLGITRSYLSTYFKEKTGVYFVDYVNSVRINKAKELLMNSDVKIQNAAAQVGYQNINSFNRMFKKFTGLTPSEFRKAELTR
jgi:two-component system response regulator YesN